jgi:hypothetical protein
METPWGKSQTLEEIADGIRHVTTSRHGGYWLSANRVREVKRRFPQWQGGSWYEEDCDWCLVCLSFPEIWTDRDIYNAVRTAGRHYGETVFPFISADIRRRAETFAETIKDKWEVMGIMTGKDFKPSEWVVFFRRVSDGSSRTVPMPYPIKQFYTGVELQSLTA